MFYASFEGKHIDGYVPRGIGIGGDNYFEIEIDIDTGTIKDWNKEKALALFKEEEN